VNVLRYESIISFHPKFPWPGGRVSPNLHVEKAASMAAATYNFELQIKKRTFMISRDWEKARLAKRREFTPSMHTKKARRHETHRKDYWWVKACFSYKRDCTVIETKSMITFKPSPQILGAYFHTPNVFCINNSSWDHQVFVIQFLRQTSV